MDQLSGILAVVRAVEARSFARAAKSIGVTASGVGKSISRLETELGVRLLSRTTRRLSLTDDGAVFFEHCRKVLDELELARGLMSHRQTSPRGRLRVSMPITLGKRFVCPKLPEFLARCPDLSLELNLTDRWINLVEDAVDVALRIGNLHDSSLVARQLGQQQVITVCSPAYLKARPLHSLDDLALHSCISSRLSSSGRDRPWGFQQNGRDIELRPRTRLAVDDAEGLLEAVCAGLGVTQVPSYVAAPALRDGSAVEVLAALRPRPMPIHAVYASGKNVRPGVRAFIDFLAQIPGLRHTESPAREAPSGAPGAGEPLPEPRAARPRTRAARPAVVRKR